MYRVKVKFFFRRRDKCKESLPTNISQLPRFIVLSASLLATYVYMCTYGSQVHNFIIFMLCFMKLLMKKKIPFVSWFEMKQCFKKLFQSIHNSSVYVSERPTSSHLRLKRMECKQKIVRSQFASLTKANGYDMMIQRNTLKHVTDIFLCPKRIILSITV